jgi:S-DNA-T family DNA segregation ATPase FtsK/SpoIIIE
LKPTPKPMDDEDSDDEEVTTTPFKVDDDIFARLESNTPASMPTSTPPPSPTPNPFNKPTSPFGSNAGTTSPFASKPPLSVSDEDDEDDDEDTPSDRTSRLDQIRTGMNKPTQFTRPSAPPIMDEDEDDDYDEDDYDEDEDDIPTPSRKPMTSPFSTATSSGGFSGYGKPEDKAGDMNDVTRSPSFIPPTFAASTPPKQDEVPQATTLPNQSKPIPFSSSSASTTERPTSTFTSSAPKKVWRLPDYRTLLASGSEGDIDREQLVRRAKVIEETLASFGAPGRVVEINTGPVITQFGVEPDYLTVRGGKKVRVKVGQIAQLDKDIQLALGAKSIRIEAPVPGKGYVGIEVPNEEAALVSLRDVMESKQFNKLGEKSPLTIALGQSVDGAPISADLASMPHLLIAGTTGSGKSVCVNAIIASLLVRNTPDKVKFIMVDPKRVELTGYNGIPHLIAPVVVELERIVGVLKWVTREMDDRYKKFSNAGARNIEDYNQHITDAEPLPYIVVIIDELADLMMLAPDETERVITRIAALARATGIHLVIATQRPSVDVVTGLIKANFPARIAFAVAGGVDSRVILDQPGAERLLGRGDMLYMSGDSPAPLRLQGVYVSDMEINNINRFWRTQQPDAVPTKTVSALVGDEPPTVLQKPSIPINKVEDKPKPTSTHSSAPSFWDDEDDDSLTPSGGNGNGSRDENAHEDELYEEAVEMVRRLNKASVSLLQRRLRIGYTRAARLIDIMEAQGVVGPAVEGSKPREVIPPKK